MTTNKNKNMRHMSFVLPYNEHAMFRFMCYCFDITPSMMLRKMVSEQLVEWDKDEIRQKIARRLNHEQN